MAPEAIPQFRSPQYAAQRLGTSLTTIRRAMAETDPESRLPSIKVRGQRRISEADLAVWLARQTTDTPASAPLSSHLAADGTTGAKRRRASAHGKAAATHGPRKSIR